MTSGVQSKDADLDSIFDPYVAGTTKARANGGAVAGSDTSNRYANIIYGSAAAATGIQSEGADLNTLYAAKGTSRYATPDNGAAYLSSLTVPIGGNGQASVSLLMTRTQYEVMVATNSGTTTHGPFAIPSGVTQFYTGLQQTSGPDSHYAQSVLHDKTWTALSTLSASNFTSLASATMTVTNAVQGQDVTGTATLTLQFGNNGAAVFIGSNGWTMTVRNTN